MYPLPGPAHAEAWPPEKRGSIGVFLQCFKSGNPAMTTDADSLRHCCWNAIPWEVRERKCSVSSVQCLAGRGCAAALAQMAEQTEVSGRR